MLKYLIVLLLFWTTDSMAQDSESLYKDSVFCQQILNNIEIKGHRIRLKTNGTNIVVDVRNSVLKDFGMANDILMQMPMVSKQDDKYVVLGRGEAIVYIGERKIMDNSELGRLSSSDIESIEIISNPDIQYDADAHAVIKIKMKRPTDNGIGVQVSLYDSQSRKNSDYEYVQMTYNTPVVNAFVNFTNNSTRLSTDQSNMEKTWVKGTLWELANNMIKWDTYYYTQSIASGVSIQPSARYSFGCSFNYSKETDRYGGISREKMLRDGEHYEDLISDMISRPHYDRWTANVYFHGKWSDKWNLIVNGDYVRHTAGRQQANHEKGSLIGNYTVNNLSSSKHSIYAAKAKVDYIASTHLQFNMGVDISGSKEDKENIRQEESDVFSRLRTKEGRYSTFIGCNMSFKPFSVEAGMRYEWINADYSDCVQNKQIVDKTYHRFFPYCSLSLPIKNVRMVLSLTSKVQRPTYYQLRNSEEYVTRYSVEAGNPLLLPQYTNTLAYSLTWRDVHFGIDYQWIQNYLFDKRIVRHEEPLMSVATTVNKGSCSAFNIQLSYHTKVGIWEPNVDISVSRTFLDIYQDDGSKINNCRPLVWLSSQHYLTLQNDWMPYVSFNYNNSGYQYEGQLKSAFVINLGLTKYFLNKSLFLRLSLNNLFATKERIIVYDDSYEFNRTRFRDTREISLLIRYTFKNNKKYKGESAATEEINRL